ncbi:MAG: hypothetical protein U0Q03_11370 [Acidimicrobiales bacterium]
MPDYFDMEVAVTVKAYPAVSTKHRETVCVAGIRPGLLGTADFVRLYPVPFRQLPTEQKFKKWDLIRARVTRPRNDTRPESHSPDVPSITVVSHLDTSRNWASRRAIVDQVRKHSMCELRARQAADGTSLGLVVPDEVLDFTITEREPDEREEARRFLASQPTLFDMDDRDIPLVEAIPYSFRYRFRCADCPPGRDHHMSIIDWEIHQAYRSWRSEYGDAEVGERLREKWLDQICSPERETMFFVGNMHQHPQSFLVLGCWWPRATR